MARVFKELFPKLLTTDPNSAPRYLDNISGGATLVLGGIFDGAFKAQSAYDVRDPGNILVDGDMELPNVDEWTPGSSAVLTKETTDPHGGIRCLRVEALIGDYPFAMQASLVVGAKQRIVGYARGDGDKPPRVDIWTTTIWTGTSSTDWQKFDVTVVPDNTNLRLTCVTTGTGHAEFDDVSVNHLDVAGKWTDISGATVTGSQPTHAEVAKAVTDRFWALRLVTTTDITDNSETAPARCMVVYDEV